MALDEAAFPQETIKLADDGLCNVEKDTGRFQTVTTGGLTKRELFAAMAMQGLCVTTPADYSGGRCNAAIVERSIILADALLAELAKVSK